MSWNSKCLYLIKINTFKSKIIFPVFKLFNICIIILLFTNCTTQKYTYQNKNEVKSRNIIIYENPNIKKTYTIVPYISILGIGVGGSYLAGELAYNQQINNGKTDEEATELKQSVWVAGALLSGYGIYYLINDSTNSKEIKNLDLQTAKDWYIHAVDFDKYFLFGLDKNRIYTIDYKSKDEFYTDNLEELKTLKYITSNAQNSDYFETIVKNSFNHIPENDHMKVYKFTDGKYNQYLESSVNNLDNKSIIEFKSIYSIINKSNHPNKIELLDKISTSAYNQTINNLNPEKDLTNKLKSITVDMISKATKRDFEALKSSQKQIEVILEEYKDNNLKREQNNNLLDSLKYFNLNDKSKTYISNLISNYDKNSYSEKLIIKEFDEKVRQITIEIEKEKNIQQELEEEKRKKEQIKFISNLRSGDCVLIGHSIVNIGNAIGHAMAKSMFGGIGGFGTICWYQAEVVKNSNSVGFKITLIKGVKTSFLGEEEFNVRDNKWKKGEFIRLDDIDEIQSCF